MIIHTKCRICHGKAVARFFTDGFSPPEMETMQQAVDKFLPLLTCNSCYDAYDQKKRLEELIFDACRALSLTSKQKRSEVEAETLKVLEYAIPKYATAVAILAGSSVAPYSHSDIQGLIAQPSQCGNVLNMIRDQTAQYARQENEAVAV